MRKLVYDCFYKDTKVTTVSTMKEANEWKSKDKMNRVKERITDVVSEETDKERNKRLERITKRKEAIKNKNNKATVK